LASKSNIFVRQSTHLPSPVIQKKNTQVE